MSMILLSGTIINANAQSSLSELEVDEQFELARETAFKDGDYEEARRIAYLALERSPDYHGILIFIARLYGWEGNYSSAKEELRTVISRDPGNRRAHTAIIDAESKSGDLTKALEANNRALEHYPDDEEFLLQKASVFSSFEEYERSEQVYKSILNIYPSSRNAREELESVRLKQLKNSVSLSFRHDRFRENFDPWNFYELQYSRETQYGSVIGRLQYANRFSTSGTQFNIDTYPSIAKGLYAYVSAGFSNSEIHPGFRFGASLYKSLPGAFEIEGGYRYLNFTTSETYIITSSLTKYYGSYMFTGRAYFLPSSNGNTLSGNLLIRRYFGSARSYVSISSGYGTASNNLQFADEANTLSSKTLKLDGQYPVKDRILVTGTAGIDSEEFRNFTRNRFSFKVGVSYRF